VRGPPEILQRGSAARAPAPASRPTPADERAERLRFSFPLLLLAGASLLASFVLYSDAFGGHATRVPLWVLALSVGLIASVGGSASLLVGDFSGEDWRAEAEASQQFVVIDRVRWEEIQATLAGMGVSPEGAASPALVSAGEPKPAVPEWSEPTTAVVPVGVLAELPPAPAGSPAPMAVTHGIDLLATEVERMVADLEETAAESSHPAPPTPVPAPRRAARAPPTDPSPNVPLPPERTPSERNLPESRRAPTAPVPRPTSRAPPAEPVARRTVPTPSFLDSDESMTAEYRVLLGELEHRAATAAGGTSATRGSDPATTVRCVGCDVRLGSTERTETCRSCRSPMCGSCSARSASEGYRGLCALCSILEESARRDGPGPA
jgi:hypothetical protein